MIFHHLLHLLHGKTKREVSDELEHEPHVQEARSHMRRAQIILDLQHAENVARGSQRAHRETTSRGRRHDDA